MNYDVRIRTLLKYTILNSDSHCPIPSQNDLAFNSNSSDKELKSTPEVLKQGILFYVNCPAAVSTKAKPVLQCRMNLNLNVQIFL